MEAVFSVCGCRHGRGIWGGLWFSCGMSYCGGSSISIFQGFFGSVGKIFNLGVKLASKL